MMGLIGIKYGMTRSFEDDGSSIPITMIYINTNRITQIKNFNKNKYFSIQVTTGYKKDNRTSKPDLGHFYRSFVEPGCGLWEFKTSYEENNKFILGQDLNVNQLCGIKYVDVTGISKGKGFSGTIKRWNFSSQDSTHGNSLSHRAPGSIGQNQTPGKVFKGKKMSGQLGKKKTTIQNLIILKIDIKNNLILIKGSIPGHLGNYVMIKPSIKKKHKVINLT
ncbi:50S ribosomal protein L3 [Candidatus Annandia adelgestsuga]|uniref:Large ribosomal subunit protein uL3 n=1 Tax=Candidatus Annandia adelgestsuga TaxID=1302411 RepID=A0A3S9J7K6_9ENTR|nr:50S ribosomal protein L3 [Candidatus Annandia adelgestsuga]AZP36222.1 50S ribosomal protein L3 [Candidatus Annandia adelgestsuga]